MRCGSCLWKILFKDSSFLPDSWPLSRITPVLLGNVSGGKINACMTRPACSSLGRLMILPFSKFNLSQLIQIQLKPSIYVTIQIHESNLGFLLIQVPPEKTNCHFSMVWHESYLPIQMDLLQKVHYIIIKKLTHLLHIFVIVANYEWTWIEFL